MSKINIRIPYQQLKTLNDYNGLDCGVEVVISLDDVDLFDIQYFKSLALKHFTVHAPFFDVSLGSLNSDVAEVSVNILKKVMTICNEIHPLNIVMHHNYQPYPFGFDEDSFVDRFYNRFMELLSSKKSDYSISLENVFETTPEIGFKLIDAIDRHDVGLCFDVGHFNLFSDISLENWIYRWKGKVKEFHIHNNFGIFDEHNVVNNGTADIERLFNLFQPEILTIENNNHSDSIHSYHYITSLLK